MNKSELVTLLRDPGTLTSKQLDEIESIVKENPYFLSARLLLAKGSKELKHPQTKKRVTSAAVYSTDRILLKKYLSGNLFFLSQPPIEVKPERKKVVTASKHASAEEKQENKREDKRPSALKVEEKKPTPEVPNVPTGELDDILEELKQDMENLKSSRAHFVEVQQNIAEEDEISSVKESIEKEFAEEVKEVVTKEAEAKELKEDKILEEEEVVSKAKEAKGKKESKEDNKKVENKKPAEKKKPVKKKTTRKASAKKVTPEEEDEIVSKKLAELAKKQEVEKKENPATEKKTKSKVKEDPKKEEQVKKPTKRTKVKEDPEIRAKEKEANNTEGSEPNERASDPFRETRFAKDATRSYLRKLDPPEDFPFFDDEDDEIPVKEDAPKKDNEEAPVENKKSTKKEEATEPKEEKSVPELKKQEATKEDPISKEETKGENKPKESKPPSLATKSDDSVMPKGSIMKKAKLVKSKRSSRRSGSGSAKLPKSDKGNEDDGKSDRADQKQIIDKFIKDSPSIKYSRESQQSTADLAESSGTWDKNLASEYLAEIYLKQGNKKRAIEIYEALSLKYPEKKSYFADLISKSK